jgi:peptide-N4-(N-acetyl-beta-glucosaminyl)asparagine amidase
LKFTICHFQFHVFTPTEDEARWKEFNVRYSCAKDQYERYSKSEGVHQVANKWDSLHFMSENIFRKVEHDWKMAYLARTEGTSSAFISWKFDFSAAEQKIKTASLKLETKTYEDATIVVKYFDKDGNRLHSLDDVRGLDQFVLRAELSGGKGDIQWQHTQLFRQSLDSKDFMFDLSVTFC